MTTNYQKGRQFEYRVKKDIESQGYYVIRSPASRGPFDLLCIKEGRVVAIQCKIQKDSFSKKQKEVFIIKAKEIGAIPMFAYRDNEKSRNPIVYEHLALTEYD